VTIRAQSADGVIHEFPDGTPDEVIDGVMAQYAQSPAVAEPTYGEKAMDVAKSLGTGVVRGAAGLAGMPADIGRGLANLAIQGGGYLVGADQAKLAQDAARATAIMENQRMGAPTSEQITRGIESVTGPLYTPRTTEGEYARTIGEFIPGAAAGPGGLVRKVAMAAVPGTLSEAGGQAAEGTAYEPAARIAGGIVGGVAAAGRGSGAAKAMQEAAPDLAAVTARKSTLYDQLENAGVRFSSRAYANFATSAATKLDKEGFRPRLHPKTDALLAEMQGLIGRSPRFVDMDGLRQVAGEIARGPAKEADTQFAIKVLRQIDDFFDSAPMSTANASLTPANVRAMTSEARELSRRSALAREVNAMNRVSPYYEGGIENEFRKYMRSRRSKRLTAAEKDAFDAVALRETLSDYAANKIGPVTGGVVGGFGGGPVGAVVGAGLTAAGQAAIKKIADAASAKQVDAALKTVLAGRTAQNQMLRDAAIDAANNRLRAIIAAGMSVQSAESNRNAMSR
jgi:hypothetical protein